MINPHNAALIEAEPRWKTQTQVHDPENGIEGNCTQAAIASLLGLELSEVPDFNTLYKDAPHAGHYWHAIDVWFLERGYDFRMMKGDTCFDGIYLADGPSPRGLGHFVVMKDGSLHHDPHPSRAGITSIRHNWILIPTDPSRLQLKDTL